MVVRSSIFFGSIALVLTFFAACSGSTDGETESRTRTQLASGQCSASNPCGDGSTCYYESCNEPGQCIEIDPAQATECSNDGISPVYGCNCRVYSNECYAQLAGVGVVETSECLSPCDDGECVTTCNDGDDCSAGNFCERPPGSGCSDQGVCTEIPDGCPDDLRPVCGCDDEEYDNSCLANQAGVSTAASVSCMDEPDPYPEFCMSNADCAPDAFCSSMLGCNGFGVCQERPTDCSGESTSTACGCDGRIYSSACEAASQGVRTSDLCLTDCLLCDFGFENACNLDSDGSEDTQSGQTRARVEWGNSGVLVPGVDAQLFKWPPPDTTGSDLPSWNWPDKSITLEDYYSRTASNTNLQDNLYYDLYTGACMDGPGRSSVDSDDWYRIEMRKDGYEPYFNYLYHEYDEECFVDDWGGYCSAVQCQALPDEKLLDCLDWGTFKVWPHDEKREKLPDLFVDRREFKEGGDRTLECAVMNPNTQGDDASSLDRDEMDLISLRVGTSVANVGSGPLHVEQAAPGDRAGRCADGAWPCPDGFECGGTYCLAESCGTDGDCPEDMECGSDGACQLPTCTSNSDCCDAQGNCAGDSRSCQYSGTCEPYYRVRGPEESIVCEFDEDCRYRENECNNGDCEHTDCQSDSDCYGDFVCHPDGDERHCALVEDQNVTCSTDSECSSGTCNLDTSEGVCEPTTRQVIETVEQTEPSWIEVAPRRVSLDNSFTFHYAHDHTHVDGFAKLTLRKISTDTKVGNGQKISFCMMDSQDFDIEIKKEVRDDPDGTWRNQGGPDPCFSAQGISPGYKDVYESSLPGQAVLLGTPSTVQSELADEDLEIKVEADPGQYFVERTRANNTASALYTVPVWSSSGFCEATRDCRDYPFDTRGGQDDENIKKNRICERYAGYYCREVGWESWCDDYPPRAVGQKP